MKSEHLNQLSFSVLQSSSKGHTHKLCYIVSINPKARVERGFMGKNTHRTIIYIHEYIGKFLGSHHNLREQGVHNLVFSLHKFKQEYVQYSRPHLHSHLGHLHHHPLHDHNHHHTPTHPWAYRAWEWAQLVVGWGRHPMHTH